MVTDQQIRRLMKLLQKENTLATAAAKAGMDEKTARKYRELGKLPSEVKVDHTWRTRKDPFVQVWDEMQAKLEINPGLEAKTLFEYLQRRYPERFSDGQLRTWQRRVKAWRALEGPPKEVFFSQVHKPGQRCQSDFTSMTGLNVTIHRQAFDHLMYHFVLTYSNWETGTICFSESFESLSQGLQNALWELGGVPCQHQTDRLSAAVHKSRHPQEFIQRYEGLLKHYGLEGRKIQRAKPHENGDVEQRHYRFKRALDQALLLRGSRDFSSRKEYAGFVRKLLTQLNAGRQARWVEETNVLRALPAQRLEACQRLGVKVSAGSTIRVNHNVYSVHSRLIGQRVEVRLYAEQLEVWVGQRCIETLERLRGAGKHRIQYRHLIDWLVRKPGAFENYRYRADLFPSSRFRMAYDALKQHHVSAKASKEYVDILHQAARQGQSRVDAALRQLIDEQKLITACAVAARVQSEQTPESPREVCIQTVDLNAYDAMLQGVNG